MNDFVETTFYVQLEPQYSEYATYPDGDAIVTSIDPVSISLERPNRPMPGQLGFRLTIRIPRSSLASVRAAATVDLPVESIETHVEIDGA